MVFVLSRNLFFFLSEASVYLKGEEREDRCGESTGTGWGWGGGEGKTETETEPERKAVIKSFLILSSKS